MSNPARLANIPTADLCAELNKRFPHFLIAADGLPTDFGLAVQGQPDWLTREKASRTTPTSDDRMRFALGVYNDSLRRQEHERQNDNPVERKTQQRQAYAEALHTLAREQIARTKQRTDNPSTINAD